MKPLNINLALIAIQIVAINEKENTAKIKFAYSEANSKGNARKWKEIPMEDVFITGRLRSKLLDENNQEYIIGKNYVSLNQSRVRIDNPFSLIRKHSVDSQGNSVPTFYLRGVEEAGSYVIKSTLPDGTPAERRIFRKNKNEYNYVRYADVYDTQKEYYEKALEAEANA